MKKDVSLFFLMAILSVFLMATYGCESGQIRNREKGALVGTATGAGLGAIIGSATGKAGVGTAIGAGVGALTGIIVGNEMDKSDARDAYQQDRMEEYDRILAENQRLIDELKRGGADAYITDRGVVINLPDVLFDFNKDTLAPRARSTIRKISDKIMAIGPDRHIWVEGHTDSIGTMSYNQGLSERRARTVARALEDDGVSRSRITTRGFGESDPIASNKTAEGRARNRRVEVIIENY
jgi:outer membrane protein OmpA-like peptidoglycan-associated protein